jgi:SAM-dependent methyltransferase
MTAPVNLYDSHYGHDQDAVYRAVRAETYDEDLGQTSWLTAAELDRFTAQLHLGPDSHLLEVACGSGGVSVRIAQRLGSRVTGLDRAATAIAAAQDRAHRAGVAARTTFQSADANAELPFTEGTFNALFCNDAINHFRNRPAVLAEWHRVLRPGGRCVFTDPIVLTGPLSDAEMRARSSIGDFLFVPPGFNEATLQRAGFEVLDAEDTTSAVASIASRWLAARQRHRPALLEFEGESTYLELQAFLTVVARLAGEGRLSRLAFHARKPG